MKEFFADMPSFKYFRPVWFFAFFIIVMVFLLNDLSKSGREAREMRKMAEKLPFTKVSK